MEKIYKYVILKIININKCLLENCVYFLWVLVEGEDRKMLWIIYLFMLDIYFVVCMGEGKYYNDI